MYSALMEPSQCPDEIDFRH